MQYLPYIAAVIGAIAAGAYFLPRLVAKYKSTAPLPIVQKNVPASDAATFDELFTAFQDAAFIVACQAQQLSLLEAYAERVKQLEARNV